MIVRMGKALRRFLRREDGHTTVEFAITFPSMLLFMLAGIELAFVTMRHAGLEHALDLTVRDIRLGTGSAPQHDEIKASICARAGFLDNCSEVLRLEMITLAQGIGLGWMTILIAWIGPKKWPRCAIL